jgi:hypothetical protein
MLLRFGYLQKKQILTKLGIILRNKNLGIMQYIQESKDEKIAKTCFFYVSGVIHHVYYFT